MPTKTETFAQFLKFAFAGAINTAIDFGVLNLLIAIFGLGQNNVHYMYFKVISFIVAVTNSYFMNKLWVFKSNNSEQKVEVAKFLGVSLVGLILNTGVSSLVFKIGPTFYPFSLHAWANIGALVGTLVVLIANFFGYKLLVFKDKCIQTA